MSAINIYKFSVFSLKSNLFLYRVAYYPKHYSKKIVATRGAWQDHTHFLAKIKVCYLKKIPLASSSS